MDDNTKLINCKDCNLEIKVNKHDSNNKLCSRCKDKTNTQTCLFCNKDFINRRKATFCSNSCATTYKNIYTGLASRRGRKSAEVQSETKRSKNEIVFYNLCKEHFNEVDHNKGIFNGWDADVIIHDIKYAVLWNGVWHYKKITKKHSLEQVENRDKIKIDQINEFGYTPYIIKDMGRYNEEFVKKEFDKFKRYIAR